MFEVPHELSNDLENEEILVKSRIHFWNSFFVRNLGPTTDLKTHKKVVYDNVTNHTIFKPSIRSSSSKTGSTHALYSFHCPLHL